MKIGKFIALAIYVSLSSCVPGCQESALSDVEITDPSILAVHGTISKEISAAGTPVEIVTVWARDKNTQPLVLKGGKITVNDRELSMNRSLIGNLPFYKASGSTVPVKEGQTYNIVVHLADGSMHPNSVKLPPNNIRKLEGPSMHNRKDDLTIKWNKLNPEYSVYLSWTKKAVEDSITKTFNGSIEMMASENEHTFSSDFFKEGSYKIDQVDFELRSTINGQVCPDLNANSTMKAEFVANKMVVIE